MAASITPREFVDKWRRSELKERSSYQEHFIDVCRLIGHPTPAELDPTGTFFCFEMGASKQGGGQGWADVWYRGHFAWEYKGKHANLDKAYQQLLQYRESLFNPPLLIVSDIDSIVIHTNFTNTVKQAPCLTLDDLLDPAKLDLLRTAFHRPFDLKAPETSEHVTRKAAEEFARLAELLRKYDEQPEKIAHFLIRLLFCLFAEDVRLLPPKLFSRMVVQGRARPAAFHAQLRELFARMATGGYFGVDEIRHFNGRLFDDAEVLELDSDGLDILARVSGLDWGSIEPSILGTLFERGLDPSKRSQLGAHYTSREDILLIVEPVLMAPLRRRWETVKAQAQEIAQKRDQAKGSRRARLQGELASLLLGFGEELGKVQVLDPACGSGNFLYVALKQLLDLWKEVSTLGGELGLPLMTPLSATAPSPEQLHGIEINLYAHQLAQATIWIGYIQWLKENGFEDPPEPVLRPLDNIVRMDAVLAYDEQGQPVEPEWPAADVIVGNPPFLGGKRMRTELGDIYVDGLFTLYKGRVPREADLVTYWFEKARDRVAYGLVKRVGLLATQGIRGGANRKVLERIKETGNIFWAQSDRDWILNGAAVHVSMIGFDSGEQQDYYLDNKTVSEIHTNLTTTLDLTKAKILVENLNICFMGVTPGGPFYVEASIAAEWQKAPINPNNLSNDSVLRHYYNGQDITGQSRGVYIIDFGVGTSLDAAALFEVPFEYVSKYVKPKRAKNKRQSYKEKWWLHAESRPAMREAIKNLERYIVTPRVSKHRLFAWILGKALVDSATFLFAREDDYFFGILHSRLHELWSRATGTQLRESESGFRYTPTTTFETFPFPWPPGREPKDDPKVQAIAEAAKTLVEQRDRWLNPEGTDEAELKERTLTKLYNVPPTWLLTAHQRLDDAVLDAYGWPRDIGDEEILERLLALNLERARSATE